MEGPPGNQYNVTVYGDINLSGGSVFSFFGNAISFSQQDDWGEVQLEEVTKLSQQAWLKEEHRMKDAFFVVNQLLNEIMSSNRFKLSVKGSHQFVNVCRALETQLSQLARNIVTKAVREKYLFYERRSTVEEVRPIDGIQLDTFLVEERTETSREASLTNFSAPRVLIRGGAGVGKSSWCRAVSFMWARGTLAETFECVLHVSLLEVLLKKKDTSSMEALLGVILGDTGVSDLVLKHFVSWINHGRVLWLLDGFDEVQYMLDQSVLEKLRDGSFGGNGTVIVTSRPELDASVKWRLDWKKYKCYVFDGFSKEQVEEYVAAYFVGCKEVSKEDLFNLMYVQGLRWLAEAVRIPLILELVCFTFERRKKLGQNSVTQLYQEVIQAVLEANGDKFKWWSPKKKRSKSAKEIKKAVKSLKQAAYQNGGVVAASDKYVLESGFVRTAGGGIWVWTHVSFRDYFAAIGFIEDEVNFDRASVLFKIFAFGLAPAAKLMALSESLAIISLEKSDEEDDVLFESNRWIGLCLWECKPKWNQDFVERLFELWTKLSAFEQRVLFHVIVSHMDDKEILTFFITQGVDVEWLFLYGWWVSSYYRHQRMDTVSLRLLVEGGANSSAALAFILLWDGHHSNTDVEDAWFCIEVAGAVPAGGVFSSLREDLIPSLGRWWLTKFKTSRDDIHLSVAMAKETLQLDPTDDASRFDMAVTFLLLSEDKDVETFELFLSKGFVIDRGFEHDGFTEAAIKYFAPLDDLRAALVSLPGNLDPMTALVKEKGVHPNMCALYPSLLQSTAVLAALLKLGANVSVLFRAVASSSGSLLLLKWLVDSGLIRQPSICLRQLATLYRETQQKGKCPNGKNFGKNGWCMCGRHFQLLHGSGTASDLEELMVTLLCQGACHNLLFSPIMYSYYDIVPSDAKVVPLLSAFCPTDNHMNECFSCRFPSCCCCNRPITSEVFCCVFCPDLGTVCSRCVCVVGRYHPLIARMPPTMEALQHLRVRLEHMWCPIASTAHYVGFFRQTVKARGIGEPPDVFW